MRIIKAIHLLAIVVFSALNFKAAEGDTTKYNFYTKYDIQQWKGTWNYKKFDFVDPTKKYKKAILKVQLGCASYGCCVWDYNFHTLIVKPLPGYDTINYHKLDTVVGNGKTVILDSLWVTRKSDNYEVGRLITPYGTYMRANSNGFSNNTWQHPYYYDITDYLPLIKDSFGIGVQSGGYDGKKGFSMSVDLYLIEGESNYQPAQVYKPFQRSYSYKNKLQVDSLTIPYKFKLAPGESFAKFRSIITGHGQEGEFSPIEYQIKLNSNQIFTKRLWREDCDKTYIQPQGGTWIFSRCNWCPGEKVETFEIDLTPHLSKTDSNEIDITFGDIENTAATQNANYSTVGHIITYHKKDSADLMIEDIIAPSNDPNYVLSNPLCQGPIIKIKNNGFNTAKKAYIDYWVDSNFKTTYIWNGNLSPEKSETINLPAFPWNGVNYSSPKFSVALQKTLQNMVTWNDTLVSRFAIPTVFNSSLIKFEIRTTNDTKKNTLNLYDEKGKIILTKEYTNDSKLYTDTITLADGCYRMELIDFDDRIECGDGLNFWWSNQQLSKSAGTFRILNGSTNAVLKTFNSDFGGKINFQFTVNNKKIGEYLATSEYNYEPYIFPDTVKKPSAIIANVLKPIQIYPNPTIGKTFKVQFPNEVYEPIELKIHAIDGREIYRKQYRNSKQLENITLGNIEIGIYYLVVEYGKTKYETKLVMQ